MDKLDKIIIWLTPFVLIFYIAFIAVPENKNTGFEECMKAFKDQEKCFKVYYEEFKG